MLTNLSQFNILNQTNKKRTRRNIKASEQETDMKKIFLILNCIFICILSSFTAFAEEEIRFTLSAEDVENNTAEVILVCDRNPGISEGEFNILYNSSIIGLNGYEFAIDGFTTEEFTDEGRVNVKFSKSDNDLSAGGKICSLIFDIKNSDEDLAGVTIEFTSLKDNDGNELSRLVESCEINIPDGIEENTDINSDTDKREAKTDKIQSVTENTDDEAEDAVSNSIQGDNGISEMVLLIVGGIMIIVGTGVLFANFKSKNEKRK